MMDVCLASSCVFLWLNEYPNSINQSRVFLRPIFFPVGLANRSPHLNNRTICRWETKHHPTTRRHCRNQHPKNQQGEAVLHTSPFL